MSRRTDRKIPPARGDATMVCTDKMAQVEAEADKLATQFRAMVAAGATPEAASFRVRVRMLRETGYPNPVQMVKQLDFIHSR